MYTIAFDTTAASCSVALMKDDKLLDSFVEEMDFGQAEVLIPAIRDLLAKHNLEVRDLGLMVVCVGPGSFTGVRSSISAARAFGLACPQMVVGGVSSFDAYANALSWNPEEIAPVYAVIFYTIREDFYYQLFDEHLNKISDPSAAVRDDIIAALRDKKVTFVGDGVERFLASPTGLSIHAIVMKPHLDVEDLARCGLRKFNRKTTDYPKPLYLRAPDVCVKLLKKQL